MPVLKMKQKKKNFAVFRNKNSPEEKSNRTRITTWHIIYTQMNH